ncbi:ABC transporter permease [Deinococcus cavernae]|uniref:ABC transporter permease n=1 Tax=Deinococcus cavernae TaxID=2320857 RepID=A0A418V6V8_9DEIO|nr:ABC transporter permease [Deinococcus cavernae]RJF71816.1 ABC transporter permease [Deinococcus cavernae]
MRTVTELHDSRPSGTAARIALTACGVALAALLLTPLAALGRSFDGSAALLQVTGQVLNTGDPNLKLPASGLTLTLAWATLALLVVTLAGAWQRARWFWITGLLAFVTSLAAVLLLDRTLADSAAQVASSTLRPGAKRALRNFYEGGGMNLGLFVPMLAGLVAAGAGLSAQPAWWQRLNRLRALLVPAAAIALAVLVGAGIVLVVQPPVNATGQALGAWGGWLSRTDLVYFVYSTLFAPITRLQPFLDSLKLATPLIFTGLSVAFAFRTGLFNIGGPGQLTMGAIAAMLVGVYGPEGLGWFLAPLAVIAAGLGGALWGAIPGFLKARFGSSEVINTIMLNYIASGIFIFLIGSNTFPFFGRQMNLPIKAPGDEAQSYELHQGARLPTLIQVLNVGTPEQMKLSLGWLFALVTYLLANVFLKSQRQRTLLAAGLALLVGALTWRVGVPVQLDGSQLNASFLIALACVGIFGVLMWRTATGYALRAVGLSPKAAEYGGISVARNTILAMTIAGMFAGLAGTHYVMGGALDSYRLKGNMPVNVGFDGIAVALMGQNTPVGVVASALLFGTLDTGGVDADLKLDAINRDIVTVLKALVVLFIAAGGFLSKRITNPPPPQLAQASGPAQRGTAETPTGTPAQLASPAPAGQPNVGRASAEIAREENTREGGQ